VTVADGSYSFTYTYTVQQSDDDPLPNYIEVQATNQYDSDPVGDEDGHKVNLKYTGVEITKTGPAIGEVDETITYTIRVTNTGEVDLYITSLMDTLLGDLSAEISGGVITVAEGYEEFDYDYTIVLGDEDPLPNVVTVVAENEHGGDEVTAYARWFVDIPYTGIEITKTGPTTGEVGETITYTIKVDNTGEVDLYVTSLDDTLLGNLLSEISDGIVTTTEDYEEFTYDYTILASDPDPLPNVITGEGENQYGGDYVTDSTSHSVDILYTDVSITKTGPLTAEVGETITYTIRVTNEGEVDLKITSLDDTLLGDLIGEISGGVITTTEIYEEFDYDYTVLATDPNPLLNTITVEATNQYDKDPVDDEASWRVEMKYADVAIAKSGPATAEIGETITYTITVYNTGNVDLHLTELDDTVLGDLILEISGGIITVAEYSETFTYTYTVLSTDPDPLVNTITVTATNQYGGDTVTDSATHRVDLLYTGVEITKNGPSTAEVGETITYTIRVTNIGDVDLYITTLSDTVLGDLSGYISSPIAEGDYDEFTVDHTVTASPDPLPNTVTVIADNFYNGDEVTASASHEVDILRTGVTIEKTGPATGMIGDTIKYTITVTNTGEVDLYTSIDDTLLGDLSAHITGGVITTGEGSETFNYYYVVQWDDPDHLLNKVTVIGKNSEKGDMVTATDDHDVDLLYTGCTIEKAGPASAEIGETITYTVTITNTGEVPLYIDYLDDTLVGDVSGLVSQPIAVGTSQTITYTYTVKENDPDPLENTIYLRVFNKNQMDAISISDSHSVDLKYTGVEITKTGPDYAEVGETITYTITIKNTGEVDLYIYSLMDTLLGNMLGEITNPIAPGDTVTFTYD